MAEIITLANGSRMCSTPYGIGGSVRASHRVLHAVGPDTAEIKHTMPRGLLPLVGTRVHLLQQALLYESTTIKHLTAGIGGRKPICKAGWSLPLLRFPTAHPPMLDSGSPNTS